MYNCLKKKLEQIEEDKKLWKKIQKQYPQLAEQIDFHMIENRCGLGNSGCNDLQKQKKLT